MGRPRRCPACAALPGPWPALLLAALLALVAPRALARATPPLTLRVREGATATLACTKGLVITRIVAITVEGRPARRCGAAVSPSSLLDRCRQLRTCQLGGRALPVFRGPDCNYPPAAAKKTLAIRYRCAPPNPFLASFVGAPLPYEGARGVRWLNKCLDGALKGQTQAYAATADLIMNNAAKRSLGLVHRGITTLQTAKGGRRVAALMSLGLLNNTDYDGSPLTGEEKGQRVSAFTQVISDQAARGNGKVAATVLDTAANVAGCPAVNSAVRVAQRGAGELVKKGKWPLKHAFAVSQQLGGSKAVAACKIDLPLVRTPPNRGRRLQAAIAEESPGEDGSLQARGLLPCERQLVVDVLGEDRLPEVEQVVASLLSAGTMGVRHVARLLPLANGLLSTFDQLPPHMEQQLRSCLGQQGPLASLLSQLEDAPLVGSVLPHAVRSLLADRRALLLLSSGSPPPPPAPRPPLPPAPPGFICIPGGDKTSCDECYAYLGRGGSDVCKGNVITSTPLQGRVKCVYNSTRDTCTKEGCFPGSSSVVLEGGQRRRMSELRLGDRVLSADKGGRLAFRTVFAFTTRDPSAPAVFVRVVTASGASLALTPNHYLLAQPATRAEDGTQQRDHTATRVLLARPAVASAALQQGSCAEQLPLSAWRYVLPSELQPGDLVPVHYTAADGSHQVRAERVATLETFQDQGIYLPHTLHGAVVVDGVLATEMTSVVVPRRLANLSPAFHAASVRLIRFLTLWVPRSWDDAIRRAVSSLHGPEAHAANPDLLLFDRDLFLRAWTED